MVLLTHCPQSVTRAGPEFVSRFQSYFYERIQSNGVRDTYGRAISHFLSWCDKQNFVLSQVNHKIVEAFVSVVDQKYKPRYTNFQLAAIHTFFDWFVKGELLPANPVASVKRSKVDDEGATARLSAQEIAQLLKASNGESLVQLRNRAMMATILHGFLSTEAMLELNVADYQFRDNRRWFHITNKFERYIPANTLVETYVDEYLAHTPFNKASDPLFPVLQKGVNGVVGDRLHPRSVQRAIKGIARRAGIKRDITPRVLRATGLRLFLEHGGSLESAAQIAGHRAFISTSRYMNSDNTTTIYEGDLDGLLDLIEDSSRLSLDEFVRRSGIFRLTIKQVVDETMK